MGRKKVNNRLKEKAKNRAEKDREEEDREEIENLLRVHNLKLTSPRRAILVALRESHGPFTADEIHRIIKRRECDQATVYRTLKRLEGVGLLRRCEFGDGFSRFELVHPDPDHHHHHLICKKCKRIEIIDDPDLEDVDRFARKRGFTAVTHLIEFFGLCPNCI